MKCDMSCITEDRTLLKRIVRMFVCIWPPSRASCRACSSGMQPDCTMRCQALTSHCTTPLTGSQPEQSAGAFRSPSSAVTRLKVHRRYDVGESICSGHVGNIMQTHDFLAFRLFFLPHHSSCTIAEQLFASFHARLRVPLDEGRWMPVRN